MAKDLPLEHLSLLDVAKNNAFAGVCVEAPNELLRMEIAWEIA